MIDGLRAAGDATKFLKAERRKLAAAQFDEAVKLADSLGLLLLKLSDTHYRIRTNQFRFTCFWELHPGNQRIKRSCPEAPLIRITDQNDWTLLTIVSATDEAIKRFLARMTDHGKEKHTERSGIEIGGTGRGERSSEDQAIQG